MAMFIYNSEIADEIIERVANGETLAKVCAFDRDGHPRDDGDFPKYYTVISWCNVSSNLYHPEFCLRFAETRIAQQWKWVEETIDIADEVQMGEETTTDSSEGTTSQGSFDKSTTKTISKDMIAHRALRISTRLKVAAMMNPELWAGKAERAKEDIEIRVHGGLFD